MNTLKPAILTIFGITGDLAKKKLLPALYHLAKDDLLPETTKIVGITRRGTTVNEVIENIISTIDEKEVDEDAINWLKKSISIVKMDITDEDDYRKLKKQLDDIEDEIGVCLYRLFYLAIPSSMFLPVVDRLGKKDLNIGCKHGETESRLLIEKPFGYDLKSAEELVERVSKSFSEDKIYRIDHFLAKETVQNILTFRFQNPIFNKSWDGKHISHIIVNAAESIDIEGRVAFYEQTGALRDVVQNHLLQLVALITMGQPKSMSSDDIHKEKVKVLEKLRPPKDDQIFSKAIRGQYKSYKTEVDNPHSLTETFAAIEFTIENEQWTGVPILVRTGKALTEKVTEITLIYQDDKNSGRKNWLTLRIQPDEGIVLDLRIKKPGYEDKIDHVHMDFCYNEKFKASHPDPYERVIVDAFRGDQTLFATRQGVLASWRAIQPILHAWENNFSPLHVYDKSSWGPEAAEKLISNHEQTWLSDNLHVCSVHPSSS